MRIRPVAAQGERRTRIVAVRGKRSPAQPTIPRSPRVVGRIRPDGEMRCRWGGSSALSQRTPSRRTSGTLPWCTVPLRSHARVRIRRPPGCAARWVAGRPVNGVVGRVVPLPLSQHAPLALMNVQPRSPWSRDTTEGGGTRDEPAHAREQRADAAYIAAFPRVCFDVRVAVVDVPAAAVRVRLDQRAPALSFRHSRPASWRTTSERARRQADASGGRHAGSAGQLGCLLGECRASRAAGWRATRTHNCRLRSP